MLLPAASAIIVAKVLSQFGFLWVSFGNGFHDSRCNLSTLPARASSVRCRQRPRFIRTNGRSGDDRGGVRPDRDQNQKRPPPFRRKSPWHGLPVSCSFGTHFIKWNSDTHVSEYSSDGIAAINPPRADRCVVHHYPIRKVRALNLSFAGAAAASPRAIVPTRLRRSAPVKTAIKTLIWIAIAMLGAVTVATIALHRGESINATWLVVAALCCYALGYRFYSKFIAAKILALDALRATPAERLENG